jgi:dihydropteroate synthase
MNERLFPRDYVSSGLTIRGRTFAWGERTYVMGIINVTPDSFSGDGLGGNADAAAALALRMEADGADWLDIGGESSRPGAEELDPAEERERLLPCLKAVRAATSLPLSVDTYHASVAEAALATGADAVNDVFGLRRDPAMAGVIASAGAVLIVMHNQRGRPAVTNVSTAIEAGLRESLRLAAEAGIEPGRVILDPGFGFGWSPAQNLEMLRRLPDLAELRRPLLVGTSRKSTIGHVLGGAPADARLEGTAATVALAISGGADIVRVHDVAQMVRVARMADAVVGRGGVSGVATVAIALGSNLGDRLGNLRAAVRELQAEGLRISARSSVWETAPVPADQPPFLNAVVSARTILPPEELLAALKTIEHRLGRRPERRWGPRSIDLDVLFYDDRRIATETLEIPHVRILERNFVLAPLAEVMRGPLPVLGRTAADALKDVGTAGLRRFSEL